MPARRKRSTALPSANRPPPPPKDGRSPSESPAVANWLLAALPPADYKQLAPALESVSPKLKAILHKPGEPLQHVYFPGGGGFLSVLTVLEDGSMVEVATIGREGMVGTGPISDGGPAPAMVMVQAVMETCSRMTAAAFRREMDRRGAFYEVMTRYAQALVAVVMQSTACNAVHSVEQRLARWLLMAHDRVSRDEFPLTQEFVAMMLGAARPTVTVVAGTLQKAGLIKYRHGRVTIVSRQGLEFASCECYRAATRLLQRSSGSRSRP
jgi:CRP-like cAMP-binding protein